MRAILLFALAAAASLAPTAGATCHPLCLDPVHDIRHMVEALLA